MKRKKITGLGDAVAAVTQVFGIQPCAECIERQNKWNVMHPFNLESREVTVTEWSEWIALISLKNNSLSNEQVVYICTFYASVFNRPYYRPCGGCSAEPIKKMINDLNKLYETI